MSKPVALNRAYRPAHLFEESAKAAMATFGKTDLYSTGDEMIDEYIGGGYGRAGANYEIVLIFGDTGMNKSTLATQFILDPARRGKNIVYFSLEDDPNDFYTRLYRQTRNPLAKFGQDDAVETRKIARHCLLAPENDGYTLDMMAKEIEQSFIDLDADICVIDPLQFIFEASIVERAETEFNRQRLFMRQMNNMMKRLARTNNRSYTLILVSHTNKGKYENAIDSIIGSSAMKQVPTKIIQIGRNSDGTRFIRLCKTRFTKWRMNPHQVHFNPDTMTFSSLKPAPGEDVNKWKQSLRDVWDRMN